MKKFYKTLTQLMTISLTLRLTFLAVLLISLSSCKGYTPPEVTLNQLNTKDGVANPFKIVKYDKKSCTLELERGETFSIVGASSPLMGGVCLTKEDYAKLRDSLETECRNENENKKGQ